MNKSLKALKKNKLFKGFFKTVNKRFNLEALKVNKVHMFGDNIGFIDLTATVKDKEGNNIPGICILRGNSVAMLTVLVSKKTKKEYFVLTHQPRIPVGDYIYEIPAGMVDDGEVVTKAIEELNEEVGTELKPKKKDMIFLENGFTSPGLLDENIDIFLFKKEVSEKKIRKIHNRKSGLENEQITTILVEGDEFLNKVDSIASKLAYYAYKAKKV